MQPTRRQFFGLFGAALAGATLDPERLLWTPGARTFFLPTITASRQYLTTDWLSMETLRILTGSMESTRFFNAQFAAQFNNAIAVGDVVRVRAPQRFVGARA